MRKWTSLAALPSTAVLVGLTSCSTAPPTPSASTTSLRQALQGGNTTDVSSSLDPPEAAAGWLIVGGSGTCTATVLSFAAPGPLLLTAAHCFCKAPGGLTAPTQVVTFTWPTGSTLAVTADVTTKFFGSEDDFCQQNDDGSIKGTFASKVSDLAIVQLPVSTLPGFEAAAPRFTSLPNVYTGADFIDRVYNNIESGFFSPPWTVTGIDRNSPAGTLRGGTLSPPQELGFEEECDGFAPITATSCHGWIACAPHGQDGPETDFGDSGGPRTFRDGFGGTWIFAINQGKEDRPGDPCNASDVSSVTWENGNGNGAFINSFFPDADGDGIDDLSDNCPPSLCPDNPFRCANNDQADADGDGWGDKCDNCPPSVCDARGWPTAACANDQTDSDNDGTGDVCDSCPLPKTGANGNAARGDGEQFADADGDGVGDKCDNCPMTPNRYHACQSDADCGGEAHCLGEGNLGSCDANGDSCASDADCPAFGLGGPHCTIPGFGRCDRQLDDPDGNKLGAVCDLCPGSTQYQITMNSNADAEQEADDPVSAMGDYCEPVPQLISRATVGHDEIGHGIIGDTRASDDLRTTFMTTATVGVGTAPISEYVGFRYCDCIDPATQLVLSRSDCLSGPCALNAGSFDVGSAYSTITTSTSGDPTAVPDEGSTSDPPVPIRFTSDINCPPALPPFAYRGAHDDCRIGTAFITRWDQYADLHADPPRIRSVTGFLGADETAGLFLSHVTRILGATTSDRDASHLGLRDSLEYIVTPNVGYSTGVSAVPYFNCLSAGCMFSWRDDWAVDPPPETDVPDTLETIGGYARLYPVGDGTVQPLGRAGQAQIDVSAALDPYWDLVDYIAEGWTFLTPAEDGVTGSRGLGNARRPMAVSIAMPWRQGWQHPDSLGVVDGLVTLISQGQPTSADPTPEDPFGEVLFYPGDRDGARAIYSGAEAAVYLVGGHDPTSGRFTGEFWRFELNSGRWTDLFQGKNLDTPPRDLLAISYDTDSHRLVFIDDDVAAESTNRRIMVADLAAQTVTSVLELPRSSGYARLSLIHVDGPTYDLVRPKEDGSLYEVRSFTISDDDQTITFTGLGRGTGLLLDDPIKTPEGILSPISAPVGADQDYVVLTTSPSSGAPTSL